ncbi:hypothetical protein [Paraglaciecola sp. MB-3u-78]|uniref:hypothetical protein n=1 Tax=Paraglaciecola sp. MB-3u-78 TaxID=2058332 RepID=UPI000C333BEB|nr:hypothetical protein [Paraglaciecola sp. MB-3u-78]PKG98750.1 hypothetical protein CXF95_12880 [Paraglaciecola sp. MB-3u-78]
MVWSLKLYNYRNVYLEDYIRSQHLLHPLYESDEDLLEKTTNAKMVDLKGEITTVLFGSIKPYKGVDKLLESWSKDLKLTILGRCSDESYTNSLMPLLRLEILK